MANVYIIIPRLYYDYMRLRITYAYLRLAGRPEYLMSVKDFYNSVTPGSSITHGTGLDSYTRVYDEEIQSDKLYEIEEITEVKDSVLNKVRM